MAEATQEPANKLSTSRNLKVYVCHCDPNLTGEGLGSHARGSLYPLLRVSLAFGWEILWHPAPGAFGKDNQTRPFYEDECKHLGEWLLLDGEVDADGSGEKYEAVSNESPEMLPSIRTKLLTFEDFDTNRLTVVNIDLNEDSRLGRILGYAGILISSIQTIIQEQGSDAFYNQHSAQGEQHQQIVL
ncbi:MAG: hypothetical protein SGARI_008112, partial [Bacillariaceae sp.]